MSKPLTSRVRGRRPHAYSTGVVTYLDILGWKGIYNRERDPISILVKLIAKLNKLNEKHRGLDSAPEIRSISDTIVLSSMEVKETDATRVIDMHGDICSHAIAESISERIPLRGATAFGDFETENNVYVGRAIDEAASWHESGEWIGVHLTPSAMFACGSILKHWIHYESPTKAVAKHSTPCVNWTDKWKRLASPDDPRRRLGEAFRAMGPITPEISPKFINTLHFYDRIASHSTITLQPVLPGFAWKTT
jgi:hypothetical protein